MNEFRRLINRKVVIGFIALLIINVSLYVYQQTKGAGLKELRFETAQRQWCVDYYGNYDIEAAINAVDSDIERILSYRKADKQVWSLRQQLRIIHLWFLKNISRCLIANSFCF